MVVWLSAMWPTFNYCCHSILLISKGKYTNIPFIYYIMHIRIYAHVYVSSDISRVLQLPLEFNLFRYFRYLIHWYYCHFWIDNRFQVSFAVCLHRHWFFHERKKKIWLEGMNCRWASVCKDNNPRQRVENGKEDPEIMKKNNEILSIETQKTLCTEKFYWNYLSWEDS